MSRAALVAVALAALGPFASPALAANPQLTGTLGADSTIMLKDADGTSLDGLVIAPGTYDIVVIDASAVHNFRLLGPGFDMATSVSGSSNPTWTVTFAAGQTWHYECQPHASFMFGNFQVASAPPPPPAQHPLSVVATGSGSITSTPAGISCPGACSAQFGAGASVSLSATPAPGAAVTWSGACSGTGACEVTMNGPKTVTATFGTGPPPATYPVAVTVAGAGSGTVVSTPAAIDCGATCTASYLDGTAVTLTATPAPGSSFDGWSGACSGIGACNLTMSTARAVTASFRRGPATPPPPDDPSVPPPPGASPSPAVQAGRPALTVRGFGAQVRILAATRKLLVRATLGHRSPALVQLMRSGREVARWRRTLGKGASTVALAIPRRVQAGRYVVRLTCGDVRRTMTVRVPRGT